MKKITIICMIFIFFFTGACSDFDQERPDDFLYNKGLEIIGVMEETASSESYKDAVLPTEDNPYFSKVSQVALGKPSQVYEIKLSKVILENQFPKDFTLNISEAFERSLVIRSKESLALHINSRLGAEAIVFSSLTSYKEAFSYPHLKEDLTYLYLYNSELAVMVVYSVYEDAISAGAYFVVNESMKTMDSVEGLEDWFRENLKIEDVRISKIYKK